MKRIVVVPIHTHLAEVMICWPSIVRSAREAGAELWAFPEDVASKVLEYVRPDCDRVYPTLEPKANPASWRNNARALDTGAADGSGYCLKVDSDVLLARDFVGNAFDSLAWCPKDAKLLVFLGGMRACVSYLYTFMPRGHYRRKGVNTHDCIRMICPGTETVYVVKPQHKFRAQHLGILRKDGLEHGWSHRGYIQDPRTGCPIRVPGFDLALHYAAASLGPEAVLALAEQRFGWVDVPAWIAGRALLVGRIPKERDDTRVVNRPIIAVVAKSPDDPYTQALLPRVRQARGRLLILYKGAWTGNTRRRMGLTVEDSPTIKCIPWDMAHPWKQHVAYTFGGRS